MKTEGKKIKRSTGRFSVLPDLRKEGRKKINSTIPMNNKGL